MDQVGGMTFLRKLRAAPMTAKLHYFRGRGNSQQARWALAAAGIPYVSVCLSTAAEFDALRASKLTFGQVPMLEDGDSCLSQSLTIVRHAARVGKLYGVSHTDAARVDEIIDGIKDARGAIVAYPFSDPREACARHGQAVQRFFPCFESILERNAQPPHAVGGSLTIADVLLAELCESTQEAFAQTFSEQVADQVLSPYPLLRALHAHVLALPAIVDFKASANWMPFPAGQVGAEYVRNVRTVLA